MKRKRFTTNDTREPCTVDGWEGGDKIMGLNDTDENGYKETTDELPLRRGDGLDTGEIWDNSGGEKRVDEYTRAFKKSGVIYISRISPMMKPSTIRRLLSPYGEIGRVFLSPEPPEARLRRRLAGGTTRKLYVDGWVEFLNKKDARLVAETLNTCTIGGKKGSPHYDDIWCIKYLKGFKWHHLSEQIANENAERAVRLRAEIAQTTKVNKFFLDNVEKSKMIQGMKAKAQLATQGSSLERDTHGEDDVKDHDDHDTALGLRLLGAKSERKRRFKQNKVIDKELQEIPTTVRNEERLVLSKIL